MTKENIGRQKVSHETFCEILDKNLSNLGIEHSNKQIDDLFAFYLVLVEWNKTHNLTRIIDEHDAAVKHFADSLLLLKTGLEMPANAQIADIGSGAGFPGIPLSFFIKDASFSLIEKNRKKAGFLFYIKTLFKLKHIEIINDSIENIDKIFNLLTVRAVNIEESFLRNIQKNITDNGAIALYLSGKQTVDIASMKNREYDFNFSGLQRKISILSL